MNIVNFIILLVLLTDIYEIKSETKVGGKCDSTILASNTNADFIIGAGLPITENLNGAYTTPAHTILWAQAIIYATEEISRNTNLLPGVTLGYAIRDTCHNDVDTITSHAVDFITNEKFYFNKTSAFYSQPKCSCRDATETSIVGIIGYSPDEPAEILAKVITANALPFVSSYALSDTMDQNKNFVRVYPSHTHIVKAIVDLVIKMNWTYVSAVAYDNAEGRNDMATLAIELSNRNACLALEYLFNEKTKLQDTIKAIDPNKTKSDIVILWSTFEQGLPIVEAAGKANLTITWITLWEEGVYIQRHQNMLGSFTVESTETKVVDFNNYLNTLTFDTCHNPWMKNFWKQIDPTGRFFFPSAMAQKHTDSVLASVFTIAHGLHRALECNNTFCMKQNEPLNFTSLPISMRHLNFTLNNQIYNLSNPLFNKFFTIKQIQVNEEVSTPNKRILKFVNIANFDGETNTVNIEEGSILWENKTVPNSICSRNCLPGEMKIPSSLPCCWECIRCPEEQISTSVNQLYCTKCLESEYVSTDQTKCLPLKNINLNIFSNTAEQILMVLSVFGIIFTLIVLIMFILKWNTPIVKSSNREMSLVQIISILLLFGLPWLHYPQLTIQLCIAQNVCFGILHSIMLSIIVIKTYRLLRVFRERRFSKVSKYLQNKYQMSLVLIPIVLLIGFVLVWYQVYGVDIGIERYMADREYVYYCRVPGCTSASDTENHVILFGIIAFLFILSIIAEIMAFRARKLPENFNEAQFIFYAMFTSTVIWVCFVFIYLSQSQKTKPATFLAVNTINTLCTVSILFAYKIGIMVFFPHWNTKSHFQKLAKNAKVVTYIQDGLNANDDKRPSKVSVISFDFDTLFRDYNTMKNDPNATKKSSHFPSTLLKRLSTIRKSKRVRRSFKRQRSKLTEDTFGDVQSNETQSYAQHIEGRDETNFDTFDLDQKDGIDHSIQRSSGKDSIVSSHSGSLLLNKMNQSLVEADIHEHNDRQEQRAF